MKVFAVILLVVNLAVLFLISKQPEEVRMSPRTTTNMPSLTLLSELSPEQLAKLDGNATAENEKKQSAVRKAFVEVACYAIGPFEGQNDAIGSAGVLTSAGLVTEIRFDTQREVTGYWVYLPPFASREEAKKVTKVLRERAVKDFQIVPKGLNKNAISLGFFSTRAAAEQRRVRMQAIGLIPLINDRFREIEGYWLYFSSPNTPPLPAEIIEVIQSRHKEIALRDRKCS